MAGTLTRSRYVHVFAFFYVGLTIQIDFDFPTVGCVVEGNLETEMKRFIVQ